MKWLSFLACLLLCSLPVHADDSLVKLIESKALLDELAPELKVFIGLTSLAFVPVMLIAITGFTRIVIVLSVLRQALGLMQTPPNIVIITLAMFLTWFAMQPVFESAKDQAVIPYLKDEIPLSDALTSGMQPFREFMIGQTREEDFAVILDIAGISAPATVQEVQTEHLIPAFLLSELRTAFQIAFVIFVPFLLVDLIVASTLMALGMIMVPPISIALPLKIMLFVLIDGWALVSHSLLGSFLN